MSRVSQNQAVVGLPVPDLSAVSLPAVGLQDRIGQIRLTLPEDYRPYTDKYFLRAGQILRAEGINPWVRGQVFIRKGPGEVGGIEEALAIIDKYSKLKEHGGRVYSLSENDDYGAKETLLLIEARAQDYIELETMYLGVLSAETTRLSDGVEHVDLEQVREGMRRVKELIGGRPVIYMGARHWSYKEDALIAAAAFEAGADMTSTDIGAAVAGGQGVGTIPHVLENVLAFYVGKDKAVEAAVRAFDRVIAPEVPRVALIDYNNREIDDGLACARALNGKISLRIDTCGENLAQGAYAKQSDVPPGHIFDQVKDQIPAEDLKYWFGNGVCVSGVYAMRKALDGAGFEKVNLLLSSGFADPAKVQAFVRAEKILGCQLFSALGVGQLFHPCRSAKMDVVAVAESRDELDGHPVSKAGRGYNPNPRLKLVLGGESEPEPEVN